MYATRTLAGVLLAGAVATGGTVAVDRHIDPYEDKSTHYELALKSDIPQGERVEIHKDKAQMDLIGWNDEYKISIIPQIPTAQLGAVDKPFTVQANRPLLSKKMEFKNGDVTAFIEPKGGTENEFDIDFTLHSKPDTNVFEYKIEGAEDFDFFYQPELTAEETAEGAQRPDNVVGSYAVYHKTKANHRVGSTNYATGKAFHIYRPKAIDANGAEVWAELSYADGVLSVTVPQKFLDDAVYPVRVDPTFGYTTAGGTQNSTASTDILCYRASAPESGSVTDVSFFVDGGGSNDNFRGAVYDDSSSPVLLSNQGAQVNVSSATVGVWATSTISTTFPSISASAFYNICAFSQGNGDFYYDLIDVDASFNIGPVYPTWPDPLGTSESLRSYSIYATYTASGGAAAPAVDYDDIIWWQ